MSSTPSPTIPTVEVTFSDQPASLPFFAIDDLYRMTVDEYEQLADSGILEERRIELIGGYLVRKMTTKPPHVWAVDAARENLERLIPEGWDLREEKPVRIPDFNEPEPDLAMVLGTHDRYWERHPGPTEIGLLVEVADSSLGWDRGAKLSAYASAGISNYWIINLVDHRIEIYTDPHPDGYFRDCQIYEPGVQVPVMIAGREAGRIAVVDLLPPRATSNA